MNASSIVREPRPKAGSTPMFSADVASTANISSLSGTSSTIDDIAMTSGFVLVKDQSTAGQNGLYKIRSGAWLKVGQPDFVNVKKGTVNALKTFFLSAANTYTEMRNPRWAPRAGFTATPASSTQITMSSTALSGLAAGMPIKYIASSTMYYAVISQVNGSSIDIKGPSLSGLTISALWIGDPELIVQCNLTVGGLYAASTGTILATIQKEYFKWRFGPASLVYFMAWSNTLGAGTAAVNMRIGSNSVAASNVVPSTSGVGSGVITAANYSVVFGDSIEIYVGTSDATAKDLSINAIFILA